MPPGILDRFVFACCICAVWIIGFIDWAKKVSPNHRGTMALEKKSPEFQWNVSKHTKTSKKIPLDTWHGRFGGWVFAPLFGTTRIGIWHRLVRFQHLQRLWQVSYWLCSLCTSGKLSASFCVLLQIPKKNMFLGIFCFFGVLGFPLFGVSVHVDDDRGIWAAKELESTHPAHRLGDDKYS